MKWNNLFYILLVLTLAHCKEVDKPISVLEAEELLPERLDFNLHVKPILSDKCYACHGPDKANQKAGLRLDNFEGATAELPENPTHKAITPKNLKKSMVFHRIISEDAEVVMPPPESNLSLTDYEKAVIIKWIEEGAVYQPHWAFMKPEIPSAPVNAETWVNNEIDQFVVKRLNENQLTPNQLADKTTLLRRVSLDLTGLNPSIEEIDAFINDNSENAYEKAVDRLLESPAYGEQMALTWMDISRFADTHGYSVDRYRDMSPWRDWVIKAFNENMPFDQFIKWQLAGDMLPNPTKEQILATGFNRNHQQNMEGGIVNEEFRVEYAADRTNTLGTALLGLTVECARCHDHKYDPITQKNYYELFSFFNNVDEAGQISWDDMMPVPTLLLPDSAVEAQLAFIEKNITEKNNKLKEEQNIARLDFNQWKNNFDQNKIDTYLQKGLIGYFPFEQKNEKGFTNKVDAKEKITCIDFEYVDGYKGKGFKSNGDDQLRTEETGVFSRAEPFSISLWINIPEELENGVIFHKGEGAIIYDFKGYHLALRDNKLEILMAHNWPYNAISKISYDTIPKAQWTHLAFTYDGLGKSDGLKLFLDGEEILMQTEKDNLYKDILFPKLKKEPALTFGARWRGTGTKDAVFDEIKVYNRTLSSAEISLLSEKNQVDEEKLFDFYLLNINQKHRTLRKEVIQDFASYNKLNEPVQEVMVMQDMKTPRQAYILERGVYNAHGDPVFPNTPEAILPFPEDLPKNRLGLADWLTNKNNPLTARVFVNRLWQKFFGKGLVTTSNDFGNQGKLPSHPALLDWLATSFIQNNWDIKAIQKTIVMSATYKQSAFANKDLQEKDPENILLARGPANRLTAEMLRDNVLKASGLLVEKIGGKSVKPYQPPGLWEVNGVTYQQDTGKHVYRRSLYTFWKRSVPPPTMNIFDAPSRSYCTVERQKTNTPLQALAMLNDPQFNEAAKVLGEKISNHEKGIKAGIDEAFIKLTGRNAAQQEIEILEELYTSQLDKFNSNVEKASGWLSVGNATLDAANKKETVAAAAVVVSAIINSDAYITKR